MDLQLEEYFSPSLSIKEKYEKQKQLWKQQIMTSFQSLFFEKPNQILNDEKETDLFVITKNNRQIAFFFHEEEHRHFITDENILCFYFSSESDIFQIINKIIVLLRKRIKPLPMYIKNEMKNYSLLDLFWEESILLSNEETLTKRELSSYFHKWSNTKCVKISSRVLFQYMDEKMGQYKNGWKYYKLNYGITEEDFE